MLLHLLGSAGAQLRGRIASCAGPPPAPAGPFRPDWKSRGGDAKLPSWSSSCARSARERRPPLALHGQWRASLRPASPGPLRRTRRHGDTLCACTPRLSSSTSRFAKMTRRLPAPPPRRSLARRRISGGIVVAPLPQHSCSCSIKAIKIIIVNCAAKMGRGDSKARCTRPPALHVGFSPIFRTHPQSVPAYDGS